MNLFGRRYRIDWGHFLTLSAMLAFSIWYLFDARSVSLGVNNLIVLQPTVFIVVGLYLFIVRQCFIPVDETLPDAEESQDGEGADSDVKPPFWRDVDTIKVVGLASSLIAYAMLYERVGIDVATLVFVFVAMFICGERRIVSLIVFPVIATIVLVYAARFLVLVPVPSTFI